MVMPFLLLQKSSFKSTSKENSECLARRLSLWEMGEFDVIVREGRTIQSKLQQHFNNRPADYLSKTFAKHMMQGKVNAALRLLDADTIY